MLRGSPKTLMVIFCLMLKKKSSEQILIIPIQMGMVLLTD